MTATPPFSTSRSNVPHNNSIDTTPHRPWLTAACERLIRALPPRQFEGDPRPLPAPPSRLLVVKVHGMGDGVMLRSLLAHFQLRHPQVEIALLAGPATREILTLGANFFVHPYNQRTLTLGAATRTLRGIRKRRYGALLNFEQGSLAGTAFLAATGIPLRIGFASESQSAKARLLTHRLSFRTGDSMWTSFARLMRVLDAGLPEPLGLALLPVGEAARCDISAWLRSRIGPGSRRLVAFHLGFGTRLYKQWPVERFVELAERLKRRTPAIAIALTGLPPERPLIDEFARRFSGLALDASGLGSIEATAALLGRCDLLVANDTGVMHLGAAVGTPTVGIFGASRSEQWVPPAAHAVAVQAEGIPCSPCVDTYLLRDPDRCANPDQFRCLREVTVEMVMRAIDQVTHRLPVPLEAVS